VTAWPGSGISTGCLPETLLYPISIKAGIPKSVDQAVAYVWEYLEDALPRANENAPMRNFMKEGEALGINRETLIVNVSAFLIISLSNTAGISSDD
jgi:hypothetical protein